MRVARRHNAPLMLEGRRRLDERLQGYVNEWTWRYNRRDDGNTMFRDLLAEAVR